MLNSGKPEFSGRGFAHTGFEKLDIQVQTQSRFKVAAMEEEEAEFSVDQIDEESILVTHRAEAHRYVYFIVKEGDRRILGDNVTIGNNGTLNDATVFGADARAFAEAEAKKRNFID
jgi:hypothetical protein